MRRYDVFRDLEKKAKREHVDEQYVRSVELVRFVALSRLLIYGIGYRVETVFVPCRYSKMVIVVSGGRVDIPELVKELFIV